MNESEMVVAGEVKFDLSLARAPKMVLAEAQDAAKALQSVISTRKNAVKFNGKHYLSFEDWQTCGRFYGVTAKIVSTEVCEMDGVKGFIAKAEAINTQTGQVVSAAESMCMNDEPNWAKKPLFQLRSMAQTRACAKSLRNCLAWVVVLAGYEPSVAEEMTGDEHEATRTVAAPKPRVTPAVTEVFGGKSDDKSITFVPEAYSSKAMASGSTKHGIKYKGDWFGCFNDDQGAIMSAAAENKTAVSLTWELDKTGKYKNILTIEAA